jgi:hypothetical protein
MGIISTRESDVSQVILGIHSGTTPAQATPRIANDSRTALCALGIKLAKKNDGFFLPGFSLMKGMEPIHD